jgi:hypothetical protein
VRKIGERLLHNWLVSGVSAQPVAGADLAVENPFEVVLAFAALQAKLGDTASAARRLSFSR